jgi:hypothetical protein
MFCPERLGTRQAGECPPSAGWSRTELCCGLWLIRDPLDLPNRGRAQSFAHVGVCTCADGARTRRVVSGTAAAHVFMTHVRSLGSVLDVDLSIGSSGYQVDSIRPFLDV